MESHVLTKSKQHIHLTLKVTSSFTLFFMLVYVSRLYNNRLLLWETLKPHAVNIMNHLWCVIGDFNEIIDYNEKWGSDCYHTQTMQRYRECVNECGLIDMGFLGPRFTWTNK